MVKIITYFLNFFRIKTIKKIKWEIDLKKDVYAFLAFMASSLALAWIFKSIINLIYFRPRPCILSNVHQLVFKSPLDASFPSGHTVVAFTLAFAVFCKNKIWGLVFLVLAVLIGFGRIFVGVHYPLDIVAGIIVALFSALIINFIIKNFYEK